MYNTFRGLTNETQKGRAINELARMAQGADEFNSIVFSGAVVDGDKFTIGGKTYHIKQFNTGSLTLGDTKLNNTTAGRINNVTITAHGLSVNQIFLCGSEYFQVLRVGTVDTVDVQRGYAGSTVAAHASGAAVKTAANYTGVSLTNDRVLPVGATLAIATAGPLLETAFNSWGDFGIRAEYVSAGTSLLLTRPGQGNVLGMTETIANATLLGATFGNGAQQAEANHATIFRVPTAAEVTAGFLDVVFPFAVKDIEISGRVTATRAPATIGGTVSFSSNFKRVRITNNATNDFAATQTIRITAYG